MVKKKSPGQVPGFENDTRRLYGFGASAGASAAAGCWA